MDLEQQFVEWIVGQTGLAAVAIFSLWVLRDQMKCRMAESKEHNEKVNGFLAMVIEALKSNTAAFTEQSNVMRELKEVVKEMRRTAYDNQG
jgi:hypothetical protein